MIYYSFSWFLARLYESIDRAISVITASVLASASALLKVFKNLLSPESLDGSS